MSYNPVSYDFDTFKKLILSDDKSEKEYNKLEEEFSLICKMIRARKKAHKTQKDVAKCMNTSSSVISRLESIEGFRKHSPTLDTLKRYARAVHCHLVIDFKYFNK